MIVDRLDHHAAYWRLSPAIAAALDYLSRTDFARLAPGRYAIDGDRLTAIVERYEPRPVESAVWESHRRHIDVQCIVQGAERMGWLPLARGPAVKEPYDPQRDVIFYQPQDQWLTLRAGDFAIFTPQDAHAPGVRPVEHAAGSHVLKVVMKVLIRQDAGPNGF